MENENPAGRRDFLFLKGEILLAGFVLPLIPIAIGNEGTKFSSNDKS
jgi:hypothetical protein